MLKRVLIANRGEIALRILRSCREAGIETVAVYSQADREALHVQMATQAVCIGPARAADSYLNQTALLTAAQATGCDGVHPGYGFLSENADFADACAQAGLTFIGPSGAVIRRAGAKSAARTIMREAGVPVSPGSDGPVRSEAEALAAAERVGYPVMLKASAGGGGRGIRRCAGAEELPAALREAQAEALACFGDGEMYLEKLALHPRHIEVQILADRQGNVVHLGDRDCSLQRRSQKLVEEAPAWGLSPELRQEMGEAAVRAARAVGYENAGTVEFLLDPDGEHFYFMEMNTRVQVEHPVTEEITGTDIIKEQLRIAAGEPMSCASRAPFAPAGHAIELRINAEDPAHGFRPCPGTVSAFIPPAGPGVRVETYLRPGSKISPHYDSLVAKVIVHGQDRDEAVARARRALDEFVIEGIATTIPFHQRVLENEAFLAGEATTDFIETQMGDVL